MANISFLTEVASICRFNISEADKLDLIVARMRDLRYRKDVREYICALIRALSI